MSLPVRLLGRLAIILVLDAAALLALSALLSGFTRLVLADRRLPGGPAARQRRRHARLPLMGVETFNGDGDGDGLGWFLACRLCSISECRVL